MKGTGQQFAMMYLAMQNPNMTSEQLTEYIERVIRPRMSTIEGVADVQVIGAADYSMRVWIDPIRLAARKRDGGRGAGRHQHPPTSCRLPARPRTNMSPRRSR